MARSTSEEEIRLRKRARRRLIGAIALTTLVVVTLPMVLDSEPRPIGDDIAVQIPSPNSGPYAPKGQAEAPRAAVPATASGTVGSPPPEPAPADRPPAAAAAAAPAPVRPVAPASATPADQKIEVAGALRSPSDAGAAAAAAAADARNAAEAAAAARASAARVAESKAAESKAAEAIAAESKAAESKAAQAARAPTEAKPVPAKAAEAKAGDTKAAAGDADAKSFVIQLGAFSEVNRAKDRHAQLVNAGVKGYTEVVKTPTGDKTRVRAGPFPNREAAEKANERLKTLGMTDGIVVPRRY